RGRADPRDSSAPLSLAGLAGRKRRRAAGLAAALGGPRALGGLAVREELEPQRAGQRDRLDQPHRDMVAQPVALAARAADQRMAVLVIAEILVADGARRNEAVGARVVELDEQADAGHPGDATLEGGADPISQEMRQQPVESLAFRLHGAPLGDRDGG